MSAPARIGYAVAAALIVAAALYDLSPRAHVHGDPDDGAVAALGRHLAQVAAQPHALGTLEHDRVRDYILATLRADGLAPEVQRATVASDVGPMVRMAAVQNVVVRIAGTRPERKALLVDAHYDAFAHSHGAADDGAGVAALLELARTLARAPLADPVVLLFSDGEEWGMLGAQAFVEQHPLARDCAGALNLDARGSGGRPYVFELGGASAPLARLFAASGAPAGMMSYLTDAYRQTGNNTDFTVLHKAGLVGFNLAFFGDPSTYHTAYDRPERLDPATLLLQYRATTALARALGAVDLTQLADGPGATFVSSPVGLLRLPLGAALPLAVALALAALLGGALVARRRGGLGALVLATGAFFAVVGGAAAAALGAHALATRGLDRALVRWEEGDGFVVGTAATALLAAGLLLRLAARRLDRLLLLGGATCASALVGVAIAAWLPGAACIPPLFVLGGGALLLLQARRPAADLLLALAAPVLLAPALFVLVQVDALGAVALGATAAPLLALLAAFVAAWLWLPVADALPVGRPALAALALLALALPAAGRPGARFDEHDPRRSSLVLAIDRDKEAAAWAGLGEPLDPWTAGVLGAHAAPRDLGAFFGGARVPALLAPLPLPGLPGPTLRKLDGEPHAATVRAEPGSFAVRCDLYSDEPLRAVTVDGVRLPLHRRDRLPGQAPFTVVFFNPGDAELRISVERDGTTPLTLSASDGYYGFPPGVATPPRPADIIPESDGLSDVTFVRRSLAL